MSHPTTLGVVPPPTPADEAQAHLASLLADVTTRLAAERAARDETNARIRDLVASKDVIEQALRPFRRRSPQQAEGEPDAS